MKKVRLFALLLTLVMATTSLLSGTVAKYSTTDSASDQATVAKWGVLLSVDGTLFGKNYLDGANSVPSAVDDEKSFSVMSSSENKLVAPGTQSDKGLKISLTGKPEVRVKVKVEIEVKNVFLAKGSYGVMVENTTVTAENFAAQRDGKGLYIFENSKYTKLSDSAAYAPTTTYFSMKDAATVGEGGYWPVVYNTSNMTTLAGTSADSTLAVVQSYLNAVMGEEVTLADVAGVATNGTKYTVEKNYNPNTDLASLNLGDETISWEWAINGNDGADTILGLLNDSSTKGNVVKLDGADYVAVVDGTDYCLNTYFGITFTVTQVD